MRSRNTFDFIKLFFKGVFMGIADAMPGVSGGTIALLVGIYEELIKSISELNISLFSELKKNGFNSFWKKLNGNFLLVLSLGIGISLISFVKISANLLENFPLYIWSFFLGLIFATIYVIYKMINHWSVVSLFFLVISILFSLFLSSFSIYETTEISLLFINQILNFDILDVKVGAVVVVVGVVVVVDGVVTGVVEVVAPIFV